MNKTNNCCIDSMAYLSFFFMVASTTQSPTQLKSVPLGRRSTLKKVGKII